MKITQEQFNSAKETFSKKFLSDIQKQTMLSNIYRDDKIFISRPIVSPFIAHFTIFRQKILVSVMIIVLLITGTSYASAMSLPGDLFYDVKVDILEPIAVAVRLSEESKNDYKISLLGKRVDELNELKKKGDIYEVSQKASSKATNKNVKELEKSAIFNEKGQNAVVSEKVKSYNELIDVNLKIETNIKIDDQDFNDENELDVNEPVDGQQNITDSEDGLIDEEEDNTDIIDKEIDEADESDESLDGGIEVEIIDTEIKIEVKNDSKIEIEKNLPINPKSNLIR